MVARAHPSRVSCLLLYEQQCCVRVSTLWHADQYCSLSVMACTDCT